MHQGTLPIVLCSVVTISLQEIQQCGALLFCEIVSHYLEIDLSHYFTDYLPITEKLICHYIILVLHVMYRVLDDAAKSIARQY